MLHLKTILPVRGQYDGKNAVPRKTRSSKRTSSRPCLLSVVRVFTVENWQRAVSGSNIWYLIFIFNREMIIPLVCLFLSRRVRRRVLWVLWNIYVRYLNPTFFPFLYTLSFVWMLLLLSNEWIYGYSEWRQG